MLPYPIQIAPPAGPQARPLDFLPPLDWLDEPFPGCGEYFAALRAKSPRRPTSKRGKRGQRPGVELSPAKG